jgi:peptide deformylase
VALLPIKTYPQKILRCKSVPVTKIDDKIHKLIHDMKDTMYNAVGIGLAANQVGQLLQIIIVDISYEGNPLILINPKIIATCGKVSYKEGCLSIPNHFYYVNRHNQITVEALDINENPINIEASGLLAIVLQHEIDHLHGKLFIDYLE